jgi:2-phosphoglycerate kinase
MAFCDFVVKYNPSKDTMQDVAKRILYSIVVKRTKAKKPTIIFIGGDSGEGKTYTATRLQEILMEIQGVILKDRLDYLEAMNIFSPLQYATKLDKILFDKNLKQANILTIHEAREVVKARLWYSFLNQSISDINAMSRSIKRLVTIILSQFIRDIDTSVRYTLTYYCIVRRPKGKAARLYWNVLWKDDRDLEKPRLRKRKLSGYLMYPSGKMRRYVPQYFEMDKPSQEIIKIIEDKDREAKVGIIRKKIDKLIKEMEEDIGQDNNKVKVMLDWYLKNPDNLSKIGRLFHGKWKLHKDVKDMHELSMGEAQEFEIKLNEAMKKKGAIAAPEEEAGLNG